MACVKLFTRRGPLVLTAPLDVLVDAGKLVGEYETALQRIERAHLRDWNCPRAQLYQWPEGGPPPQCALCEALQDAGFEPRSRPVPPKPAASGGDGDIATTEGVGS